MSADTGVILLHSAHDAEVDREDECMVIGHRMAGERSGGRGGEEASQEEESGGEAVHRLLVKPLTERKKRLQGRPSRRSCMKSNAQLDCLTMAPPTQ